MRPSKVIDVSRGSNQNNPPRKKTWTGNTETYSRFVSRRFSKFARQKFPKCSPGPSETAEKNTFFFLGGGIREIYVTEISLLLVFENLVAKISTMFSFRFFFLRVFCPQWPFSNQKFLCGFSEVAETFLLLQTLLPSWGLLSCGEDFFL